MSVFESELNWVVCKDEQLFGPLSAMEIKKALIDNELADDDPVWKKGWSSWKLLKDVPVFAYECGKSRGLGRALPELNIPNAEEFKSVVSPKVSAKELQTHKNWSAKRIAVVSGATILFGPLGGVGAAIVTKKSVASRIAEESKNQSYIDESNR